MREIKLKLTNKEEINKLKTQKGFSPIFRLYNDGDFIINSGKSRVQLARSFGVQFNANLINGEKYFSSKINSFPRHLGLRLGDRRGRCLRQD